MWKIIGVFLVLTGIAGLLYSWVIQQKERQNRLEELIQFIHKTIFAMENEKLRVIEFFEKYHVENNTLLGNTLHEIAERLQLHIYPSGQDVWEEVFREKKQEWILEEEIFQSIMRAGNGFFGRSREENISVLQKWLKEIERLQKKEKEKEEQERKVWIPIGMLGGLMIIILFI